MNIHSEIRQLIASKDLKVTPQRMKVLEAIYTLNNHPTAENIITQIRIEEPNISAGTVYKVLEDLVAKNLLVKVKTEKDVMRYDGILNSHHHLYCIQCDYIEDYENAKLDELINNFFKENPIENFIIEDIKININGNFIQHKNQNHD